MWLPPSCRYVLILGSMFVQRERALVGLRRHLPVHPLVDATSSPCMSLGPVTSITCFQPTPPTPPLFWRPSEISRGEQGPVLRLQSRYRN